MSQLFFVFVFRMGLSKHCTKEHFIGVVAVLQRKKQQGRYHREWRHKVTNNSDSLAPYDDTLAFSVDEKIPVHLVRQAEHMRRVFIRRLKHISTNFFIKRKVNSISVKSSSVIIGAMRRSAGDRPLYHFRDAPSMTNFRARIFFISENLRTLQRIFSLSDGNKTRFTFHTIYFGSWILKFSFFLVNSFQQWTSSCCTGITNEN